MWMEAVEYLVSNMRLSLKDKDYRDYQGFNLLLYLFGFPIFIVYLLSYFMSSIMSVEQSLPSRRFTHDRWSANESESVAIGPK